ncbi:MAG: glycosyltransferase family 2 protein [Elusimicrobia bacterium]|nr:glycosyltransferase family 2 protein [Elusimicrobiota bacterium]
MKNVKYSVVVPVYREEDIIINFFKELNSVMNTLKDPYEIIFVDDQTDTNTVKKIKEVCDTNPQVKLVNLSRNFGHQVALTAGIDLAKGDAVIMLDGDLQHPPSLLPELIDYWKDGYDVVYTVRQDHKGTSFFKRIAAYLFYTILNKISDIDVKFNCADFRLMSRKAVESLKKFREHSPFLRGLVNWMGYKRIGIPFESAKRAGGTSKYSYSRLFKFAMDGIIPFSEFPIRIITVFGLIVAVCSFIYIFAIIYYYFFSGVVVPGWYTLIGAILLLGGVQIVMIGIVGEYIAKIFYEVKNRPLYLIDEIYGSCEDK